MKWSIFVSHKCTLFMYFYMIHNIFGVKCWFVSPKGILLGLLSKKCFLFHQLLFGKLGGWVQWKRETSWVSFVRELVKHPILALYKLFVPTRDISTLLFSIQLRIWQKLKCLGLGGAENIKKEKYTNPCNLAFR